MVKRQNTQTNRAQKGRMWWFIIPVVALISFGCEKDIVSTVSEENGRQEFEQAEAVSLHDERAYGSSFVADNEIDDKLAKCIIMPELPDWASDYFKMERVRIQGNVIRFTLSYPGGARKHEFRLVSTTFKESYPVQVSLQIFHDGNNDPADGIVTEVKSFDLSPLKELYFELYRSPDGTGTIIINITDVYGSNDSEPLIYKFDKDNQILPPRPPLPPDYERELW
jgi:hypothetical protein